MINFQENMQSNLLRKLLFEANPEEMKVTL